MKIKHWGIGLIVIGITLLIIGFTKRSIIVITESIPIMAVGYLLFKLKRGESGCSD